MTIIILNLAMVIVSWTRFIFFFFVISSMSKLLLTLQEMIKACLNFLVIAICYMLIMAMILGVLFQEQTVNYYDTIITLLTLWDTVLTGAFQALPPDSPYFNENNILYVIHVIIGNVYLTNYLIALVSTVYENLIPKGDFAYKSNKYMYIERFYIPMEDEWGYS